MDEQLAAARRLIELAKPYLLREDRDGLAGQLSDRWSPECLRLLLSSDESEVARTAAACLGLVGDLSDGASLAGLLHHQDAAVVAAAEDALWSIWFRAAGPMAQSVLTRIVRGIRAGETENVVPLLTELIRAYPCYAEAYHQRSQAYYLQNCYQRALRDARRACELNPLHFSALANEAHALAALGRSQEALATYRRLRRLHPTMPGIHEAISHLRCHLAAVGA
jgi:tetratricopeptide (TPR) repeat protein